MPDTSCVPSKRFCCLVENCTAAHLVPLIAKLGRQWSIIHTDDFFSYKFLQYIEDYEHRVVIHKYHLINPDSGVHIQNVESFNN